jgi:hypothetical protein
MTKFSLLIDLSSAEIRLLSSNQNKTGQAVPRAAARWLVEVNLCLKGCWDGGRGNAK